MKITAAQKANLDCDSRCFFKTDKAAVKKKGGGRPASTHTDLPVIFSCQLTQEVYLGNQGPLLTVYILVIIFRKSHIPLFHAACERSGTPAARDP
jgi:hypothetical protein